MKNQNKTVPTSNKVEDYLNAIEDDQRKIDCIKINEIIKKITKTDPVMWGSIVGYGTYHYKSESGREGDYLRTGFSNRKAAITVYIMPGYQDIEEKLQRLGKHKLGKSCLYIKKLSDIDESVFEEIVKFGWDYMHKTYPSN